MPGLPVSVGRVRLRERRAKDPLGPGQWVELAALLGHDVGAVDVDRYRLLARLAMLTLGAEDERRAAELVDLALTEAGSDPQVRAGALAVGAIVDLNVNQLDRSAERFEEALELFQRGGDARGVAGILDGRAMAAFLAGRIRESAEAFDRAAILYVDSGQLLPAVSPRASRVHALVKLARPDDALADGDAAVDLARALGHPDSVCYGLLQRSLAVAALGRGLELADRVPYHWSHCANGLARLLIARGELDAAEPLLARSLAEGLPLTAYEARAAQVELLAARGQEAARPLAREAMALAEQGGYLVVMPRLQALTKVPPSP